MVRFFTCMLLASYALVEGTSIVHGHPPSPSLWPLNSATSEHQDIAPEATRSPKVICTFKPTKHGAHEHCSPCPHWPESPQKCLQAQAELDAQAVRAGACQRMSSASTHISVHPSLSDPNEYKKFAGVLLRRSSSIRRCVFRAFREQCLAHEELLPLILTVTVRVGTDGRTRQADVGPLIGPYTLISCIQNTLERFRFRRTQLPHQNMFELTFQPPPGF